jgi:tetratricopeptide (TPR) repeat protein
MHVRAMSRLPAIIAGFLTIMLYSSGVLAGQETADWWKAQREANIVLMEGETSIAELVANPSTTTPENAQDAMFKVCVLMRAGMNKETIEALHELKTLAPQMENHQIACIYYGASDSALAWDVAKATLEVFSDNISELALENRLLKHFLNSGWKVDEIDTWLAGMPKGTQNFWVKERLRFNVKHGRGEALVRELSDSVRENPQEVEAAIAFLDALIFARSTGDETWELSWMAETIRPKLATQAEKIASRLKTLAAWTSAARFYRQAVDIPLTEEEVQELGMMCSAFVPVETLRAMFAAHTREGMAECLLKSGEEDQAQKWMVEAADIREKHNLGLNALFAGQTQAASGQRTIEGRIRENEEKSKDDPQYWRERAQYYRGRSESVQEEEALLKGLALTKPQPEPEQPHRGHVDWRSQLLADYARFLMREKRRDEAAAFLRKEINEAPAVSESTKRAAHFLAFDLYKEIHVDDPVLWNWLANRPKWEHTEERLLWRMLESAERDNLDKYFIRAEEAALGKDPSRAHTLGWIMNRMHFPKRSIPLLKHAIENARDKELKERAVFTLFESYLDTGDWKHAEEIFPDAAGRLTPKELPEWYSRVAVTAAKAGAKSDAMRIWGRVANLSPSQIDGLEDLVEAGLRDELKSFYRKMQKEMPSSEVPARALTALQQK